MSAVLVNHALVPGEPDGRGFKDDEGTEWTHRIGRVLFGDYSPVDEKRDAFYIHLEEPPEVALSRGETLAFLNACAEFMGFSGTLTDDK